MINVGDVFYHVNRNDEIDVVTVTFKSRGVWHLLSEKGYAWDNYDEKSILDSLAKTKEGAVQQVIDRLTKSIKEETTKHNERIENLAGNILVMEKLKNSIPTYSIDEDISKANELLEESRSKVVMKGLKHMLDWVLVR